jgi:hypothetical protein
MCDRTKRVNCALVLVSPAVSGRRQANRAEVIQSVQDPQENDGLVVFLVARTVEQRDLSLTDQLP